MLALGSGLTLLGVIRVLHHAGADILALPDVDKLPRRSRWFRAAPMALAGLNSDTLESALSVVSRRTVLLPCSDSWLRAVARLPAGVLADHPASVAPPEALDVLLDKALFGAALTRLGLPHPMTLPVRTPADLDPVPDSGFSGSFLKPAGSQEFFARFGVKAFRVTDRADARSRLAQCEAAGLPMLLQEYVPGPPSNHYYLEGFIDRAGVTRARFARRRLRMYPPDFGNSTIMVSVSLGEVEDGVATLDALFEDLRYRGIFSAEFKRDASSGQLKLLEVNARPWWYVEFAARCGVDVSTMAVLDALGKPVPDVQSYATGRRCVYPYYDRSAARAEWSAGRLGLWAWARSWIGAYQPVFRWSDPLPAWGSLWTTLTRRAR